MSIMGTNNGRKQHSAGRALDDIFVERLWRSVKYEEVYLHDYATVTEARLGLKQYSLFYNTERQHQSLDYRTPQEVYEGQESGGIRQFQRV
jgi:putative transposase